MTPHDFEALVRCEYREMPGLRLTIGQAAHFWQRSRAECERTLRALVKEKFLLETADGTFMLTPQIRTQTAKATMSSLARRPRGDRRDIDTGR
jgi:hypothetical protein